MLMTVVSFDCNPLVVPTMLSPTQPTFFPQADHQGPFSPTAFSIPSGPLVVPATTVSIAPDMPAYAALDPFPPANVQAYQLQAAIQADLAAEDAVNQVVLTIFDSVVQTSHSARQAYLRGDSKESRELVEELKKAIAVIQNLQPSLGDTQLPPCPITELPTLRHPLSRHASPPFDPPPLADSLSRKRCASALEEDRAPKMIKLEPSPPVSHLTIVPPPLHAFPVTSSALHPSLHAIAPPLSLAMSSVEHPDLEAITPTTGTMSHFPVPPTSAGSATTSFPSGVRSSRSSSTASLQIPPPYSAVHPLPSEEYGYYSVPHSPEAAEFTHDDDSDGGTPEYLNNAGRPIRSTNVTGGNAHSHRRGYSDSNITSGNEVPPELRHEVDRIFFEFLNRICSNLDATDAKGELIHQTLMAKKMQRLDESPDYRPFKFRIQAFTNAFLEELARQGYPEDKIPMKKIRHYLWNQPYISRFNEDGKKTKSKGNHIWNIEARKSLNETGSFTWSFRKFSRKISGTPPSIAYVGLRWNWTPRVWDPQAARQNVDVQWRTVKSLSWLGWEAGTLAGTPGPASESGDVIVAAVFTQDTREVQLTHTFHITVAPMAGAEPSPYSKSRRPSLAADGSIPRRGVSDSVLAQSLNSNHRPTAGRIAAAQAQANSGESQVVQVVKQAAKRVATAAAQSQHAAAIQAHNDPDGEETHDAQMHVAALTKQQQVLDITAEAFDEEARLAGGGLADPQTNGMTVSSVLVAAAQQIVHTAALQVVADRSAMAAAMQLQPVPQPTLNEVSVATQSAVAQAVALTGPVATEVEVLMTASALIQQQARTAVGVAVGMSASALGVSGPPPVAMVAAGLAPADHIRPHSTGGSHASLVAPTSYSASMYLPTNAMEMEVADAVGMENGPQF